MKCQFASIISRRDIRYISSELKRAGKDILKQKKLISRGVGVGGDIEQEYRFLGYLEGKESSLKMVLSLIKVSVG